jgi:cyclic pyranopterin monophosphate synthase
MVDVGPKPPTRREAVASARIRIGAEALALITSGGLPKGDAFAVARIAGIQAAKRTADLIPLCHPLPIEAVEVKIEPEPPDAVRITASVRITARTGVEMEALTAVSVAALALYDMCKSVTRDIEIGPIRLDRKTGGKSATV